MACNKVRWLMVDDCGLLRVEQGSAPIHVALPNTATILDILCSYKYTIQWLDFANVFFGIPLATESQDIFAFTWEG